MKIENLDFYYFSGTGNTLLIVKKMVEIFEKYGIKVNLFKIEDSNSNEINLNHTIGLGFPIAELSTYDFVWNFIKDLPQTDNTDIFMVDTLGGFSGGIVGPVREIVKKKGYHPIGAKEIIMPSNIFYIPDKSTTKKKIAKGLIEAERYANSIIKGESNWGRVPLLSDGVYYISRTALKLTHSNLSQKYFCLDVDKEKCNKCGWCVELCPIKNIQIGKDRFPVNLRNCCYCLRCTSFCPKKAISAPFNFKGKTYRAVKTEEFLKFNQKII
ncbi:EFR1 family ferrodoxin [Methanobacterium alcaliphilum]|uniref:EFR1 family ferrodoxin n=1 Tax=Methanobacterium alcaliphilum TaxID=392018 RepID=UPI00200A9EBD|nr:EFR1 family ferrodoxin [Methanobacterium alcaliphilum]MCK9150877.1 EFR1 family ferrodoxin [Methanobacterium alcaliphilum]